MASSSVDPDTVLIDILTEEEQKGNMPKGGLKNGGWGKIVGLFKDCSGRKYSNKQLKAKYSRLKARFCTFTQLISRTRMGWDAATNTVTGSEECWAHALAANYRAKDFKKKGLDHYVELKQLFSKCKQTGHFQISSSQPAPDSDEERELAAAYHPDISHLNVGNDHVELDDVEDLPTPCPGQSATRRMGQRPVTPQVSAGKRKKGNSLDDFTDAVNNFAEVSRARRARSSDSVQPSVNTPAVEGDFTIYQAMQALNELPNLDNYSYGKIVEKLHNLDSRSAFMAMPHERRIGWIDFVASSL